MDMLETTINAIKDEPELAKSRFHAFNKWISGGQNQSSITSFYSNRQEIFHKKTFTLNADEPEILAGNDTAPNPVEYLLQALISCLTSSLVYHAAAHNIHIREIESEIEGYMDIRGFMGLSNDVRKGYDKIRINFRVKSDSKDMDLLKSFFSFSPVYDVVSRGTNVEISIHD
jgi:uncharacterized OsmC-like protein